MLQFSEGFYILSRAAVGTVRRVLRRLTSLFRRTPAPVRSPDVLRISYAPHPDGDGDPGEVVWTWVPYEDDPAQGKDRPVVLFGRRNGGLVGVALTSRGGGVHEVLVGTGAWDPQRRPSYAKLDRILDVDGDRVRRVGGVLDQRRFDDLVVALRGYYS